MMKASFCILFSMMLVGFFGCETEAGTKIKKIAPIYKLEKIFNTDGVIWGFDFLSDTQVIYSKRSGGVWLFNLVTQKHQLLDGSPQVFTGNQAGMLDVKASQAFAKDHTVYMSYSVEVGKARETRISKAQVRGSALQNMQVLFTSNTQSKKTHHFGSRICLDGDGYLFFSVGDRGHRDFAQVIEKDHGKIFRVHTDGRVPSDNPFVSKSLEKKSPVWSFGHRNPQGLYCDHHTRQVWSNEHGPKGGDEINQIIKGANYGWPIITYGREYSGLRVGKGLKEQTGMEQPLHYFTPSIAPSGLSVYRGHVFPEIQETFLSGALALKHLNIVTMKNTVPKEQRWLAELDVRVRNVRVRDGYVYVSTDAGELIKISR